MTIVQWNARSLATRYNWAKIAEFQKFLESFDKIPEVLCIQETWNHKGQKELKNECLGVQYWIPTQQSRGRVPDSETLRL